jgi:hypothetical protein
MPTKPKSSKPIRKVAAERLERLKKQKAHPTAANKEKWELERYTGISR